MNKINLIIDGNYFTMSRFFAMPQPKKIPGLPSVQYMSTDKDKGVLMRKLAMDFASEMRKLRQLINKVIFVVDSGSWRKDMFPEAEYKGTREYDDKVDWSGVFEVMYKFKDIVEKFGVITSKVPGAEGDDLLFAWSSYFNSIGENVLLWTGDKDMKQLVNHNKSMNTYTFWYDNTRSIISSYPGFQRWLNTKSTANFDMFSKDTSSLLEDKFKGEIINFIENNRLKLEEIHCDDFALEKILTGDKGDNVKSVIYKKAKKGDRMFKFSSAKTQNLLQTFKKRHGRFSTMYLFIDSYKEEIAKLVGREMKIIGKTDEIKSSLELNTNLVLLHSNTIPKAIQELMYNNIEENMKDIKLLDYSNIETMQDILKGTEFIKEEDKGLRGGAIGLF